MAPPGLSVFGWHGRSRFVQRFPLSGTDPCDQPGAWMPSKNSCRCTFFSGIAWQGCHLRVTVVI